MKIFLKNIPSFSPPLEFIHQSILPTKLKFLDIFNKKDKFFRDPSLHLSFALFSIINLSYFFLLNIFFLFMIFVQAEIQCGPMWRRAGAAEQGSEEITAIRSLNTMLSSFYEDVSV